MVREQIGRQGAGIAGQRSLTQARFELPALGIAFRLLALLLGNLVAEPRRIRRAQRQQPRVQLGGRDAVFLIVADDVGLERRPPRRVALEQVIFEGDDRLIPLAHVRFTCEAVERLELLDRVAVLRLDERAQDDRVEIDQHVVAQQVVDLVLARRVVHRQPPQRGLLVGRVMVHVRVRVLAAMAHEPVDEPLERALLPAGVVAPLRVIRRRTAAHVRSEEILQLGPRLVERVSLHVEIDVVRVGPRQQGETFALLHVEQLVQVVAGGAPFELQPCLTTNLRERSHPARRGKRRDPALAQTLDLLAPDRRDERQVIGAAANVIAVRGPRAVPARLDAVGNGVRAEPSDRRGKTPFRDANVRQVLHRIVRGLRAVAKQGSHDRRVCTLDRGDELGVHAELHQKRRFLA